MTVAELKEKFPAEMAMIDDANLRMNMILQKLLGNIDHLNKRVEGARLLCQDRDILISNLRNELARVKLELETITQKAKTTKKKSKKKSNKK